MRCAMHVLASGWKSRHPVQSAEPQWRRNRRAAGQLITSSVMQWGCCVKEHNGCQNPREVAAPVKGSLTHLPLLTNSHRHGVWFQKIWDLPKVIQFTLTIWNPVTTCQLSNLFSLSADLNLQQMRPAPLSPPDSVSRTSPAGSRLGMMHRSHGSFQNRTSVGQYLANEPLRNPSLRPCPSPACLMD